MIYTSCLIKKTIVEQTLEWAADFFNSVSK